MLDRAQAIDKPMREERSREERIRDAAYHRHLARGDAVADPETDWLEAEAEVDAQDSAEPSVESIDDVASPDAPTPSTGSAP